MSYVVSSIIQQPLLHALATALCNCGAACNCHIHGCLYAMVVIVQAFELALLDPSAGESVSAGLSAARDAEAAGTVPRQHDGGSQQNCC